MALKERYVDFFHKGTSVYVFWSVGQTRFYGTIRKISGRDIRDRDYLKKIRDGTFGIEIIKKFVPQVSSSHPYTFDHERQHQNKFYNSWFFSKIFLIFEDAAATPVTEDERGASGDKEPTLYTQGDFLLLINRQVNKSLASWFIQLKSCSCYTQGCQMLQSNIRNLVVKIRKIPEIFLQNPEENPERFLASF